MADHQEKLKLLESNEEEIITTPNEKKGMFISYRMGVAVGLLWIGSIGYVSRSGVDPLELSKDDPSSVVNGDTLSMFKRTHLSINAIKEGIWLKRMFGFGVAMNEYWDQSSGMNSLDYNFGHDSNAQWEEEALKGHNHDEMEICAARSIFTWSDIGESNIYNWHEFQGSQTPTGALGADYWWDLIYKMNTEKSEDGSDQWSVFLHKGTHMYVKDLSKHMDVFVEEDVPHLTRRYVNVADGKLMYAVFVPNPYNGNTVILHGKDVSKKEHKAKFVSLEEEACEFAVSVPYSTVLLDKWYDELYIQSENLEGLPKPYPVLDSQPTYDIDEVATYFDKIDIESLGTKTVLHEVSESCQVYTISMATQFQTPYQARFIYTPNARNFDTVGTMNKYLDTEVRKTTSANDGYSRWLDEHWGFTVRQGHTLDQLRYTLEDSNTPYHAHVTEIIEGNVAGSLWAWGVSGMAIEWHGVFDYSSFHDPIGGFDFCTVDTVCQAADENCLSVVDPDAVDGELAGATRK